MNVNHSVPLSSSCHKNLNELQEPQSLRQRDSNHAHDPSSPWCNGPDDSAILILNFRVLAVCAFQNFGLGAERGPTCESRCNGVQGRARIDAQAGWRVKMSATKNPSLESDCKPMSLSSFIWSVADGTSSTSGTGPASPSATSWDSRYAMKTSTYSS